MNSEKKIKALLTQLYDLVSGPEYFKRNWQEQLELFTPYAKMIRTSVDRQGNPQALVMDIQDYPENFQQLVQGAAFYEVETHSVIESFGNIAHAFSTYEAWRDSDKTQFIKRGINSIQLYNDGRSWKIVNMIWDDERPGLTIPPKYNSVAAL
ncbi:hypothetical protein ACCI51_04995 [Microbulbifer echini]|uniref:SnoaL-like domain-containing protein n=1 Tax=Microbulbifer echini TaxID=1529067 RepID=A0ABV4NKD6_9GAMM|nr:hypothetical protein [uncultured Microbulbifer sp.]